MDLPWHTEEEIQTRFGNLVSTDGFGHYEIHCPDEFYSIVLNQLLDYLGR